jgi:hypothetical protein
MISNSGPSDRRLGTISAVHPRCFFLLSYTVFFFAPDILANRSMTSGTEFSGSSGHRAVLFPLASTGQPTCIVHLHLTGGAAANPSVRQNGFPTRTLKNIPHPPGQTKKTARRLPAARRLEKTAAAPDAQPDGSGP